MYKEIIQTRLETYKPASIEDEQSALKEILQEIVLYSLSSSGFFKEASFHGGTALRILYNLPRFSEDLDFCLNAPNPNFQWQPFFESIENSCKVFGIEPEIIDKSKTDSTVQKMFLKDNSIGKLLSLKFHHHSGKKFQIKMEIDTNPPEGASSEIKFIDFPLDTSIVAHDLPSCFAGKLHALLCRKFVKGRDWYDFTWYIKNKVKPNIDLLSDAINQQGPWQNEKIQVDTLWLVDTLTEKISQLDWKFAAEDVKPFLSGLDRESVELWSKEYFLDKVQKFQHYVE